MKRATFRSSRLTLVLMLLLCGTGGRRILAQGPTIEGGTPSPPGAGASLLGPMPGAVDSSLGNVPGADQPTIGGAAGPLTPKVPPSITIPGATSVTPPPVGMSRTPTLPASELPVFGSLALPTGPESEGPPTGMTLDQAIEYLVVNNLDLRAKFYEIPQADADILTASLRANPIFYADAQLIPYGKYTRDRPGGQTQYDVNVTIPLDVNNKRGARMEVAGRAKRVIEAQYQDAVRLTIDNLYTAFVDVLAARETVRFAKASVEGFDKTLEPLKRRLDQGLIPPADYNRVHAQREGAQIGLDGAEETLLKTKHILASLLNISPADAEGLEVRGSLQVAVSHAPAGDELVRIALENRPDLMAFRLGVHRAVADVELARRNRYADVYWLVQPYTLQDNTPLGLKSPTSWAMGVTVPLPIMNRNQGNIQRARLNVAQTQTELAAIERQIIAEVRNAEKDYLATLRAVQRFEKLVLPDAIQVRDTMKLRYDKGEVDVVAYLIAEREKNDYVRQYRDVLVQHRRSMLQLNTALGRRIFP